MERNVLEELQQTQLEILLHVKEICEKHNLTYFLIGGTLLGAIRHKGFIPWDDDLDIAMPRRDYEHFLALCKDDLASDYYLHCNKTDPDYWLPFTKIRKNGTVFEENSIKTIHTHKGIFIDVFPLDNANAKFSLIQSVQARLAKGISSVVIHKRGLNVTKVGGLKRILLTLLRPTRIDFLTRLQTKVMIYNRNNEAPYFVNLGSNYNYKKQTINKDKYYPPVKVQFEGHFFDAPSDWDYILKRIYGDYMQLPPPEKRITHNPVRIDFGDDPDQVAQPESYEQE